MVEEKLRQLGINLPASSKPLGFYVPLHRVGNLIFLSGILPLREGGVLEKKGKVGRDITLDEAALEAKQVVINALSIVKENFGSLDCIKKCVRITGYISATEDFTEHPKVLNPASELLFQIFGEKGKHCRVAVGVCSLPFNAVVEMDFIFEVD